jgi:hypothetical protein
MVLKRSRRKHKQRGRITKGHVDPGVECEEALEVANTHLNPSAATLSTNLNPPLLAVNSGVVQAEGGGHNHPPQ